MPRDPAMQSDALQGVRRDHGPAERPGRGHLDRAHRAARHRPDRAPVLRPVQPHPGHARRPARHRRHRALRRLRAWPRLLDLRLLSGILQTGAVVGLLALVVIFQPELRRASSASAGSARMGWAFAPSGAAGIAERRRPHLVADRVRRCPARGPGRSSSSSARPGLEDAAETGVMLHADLCEELLASIFAPRDGAPRRRRHHPRRTGSWRRAPCCRCPRSSIDRERYGTRHRAAIGITEQTDAVVIVVSEETGSVSLVQRGRMSRDLDEERLRTALVALLRPSGSAGRAAAGISALGAPFVRGKRPRVLRRRRDRIADRRGRGGHDGRRDRPVDGRPRRQRCGGRGRAACRGRAGEPAAGASGPAGGWRVRRLLDFVLRNWPLKLAAIGLATVLYAGVSLSGNERTWPGAVPIEVLDPPAGAAVLDLPGSVTEIRYRAPIEAAAQLTNGSFLASIDLADVTPTAGGPPVPVLVRVTPSTPGSRSSTSRPRSVNVRVDQVVSRPMTVTVERGTVPRGLALGAPVVTPATVILAGRQLAGGGRPVRHRPRRHRRERPERGPGGGPGGDRRDGRARARRGDHPAAGPRAHRGRPGAGLRHPARGAGAHRERPRMAIG